MRTLYRYLVTIIGIGMYFWLLFADFSPQTPVNDEEAPSYWTEELWSRPSAALKESACLMETCFNYSKCENGNYKVYVYPNTDRDSVSLTYSKILTSIMESAYYTEDYTEACLFVLAVDTIDRDKISTNFVPGVDEYIKSLPADIWNNGENHIIFNMYHGTYPDYADHNLEFNTGKAIIARSSPSVQHFRFGFDVSFPLFHKEHALRTSIEREFELTSRDQYLVSFKGKRYVYGIGSETRDALHHLHNGESIAMVTTCKHNTDWKEHQDSRCAKDNEEYDKWDYHETMANSTFCLAPRGRRLGSFRFLESLKIGCIPVVLSDDWVLPFAETIDWSQAVVTIAETNVLLVPDILYTFSSEKIVQMKQNGRYLHDRYFRDVEHIVLASLQTIFDRLGKADLEKPMEWSLRNYFNKNRLTNSPETYLIRAGPKNSNRIQKIIEVISKVNPDKQAEVVVIWPEERGSAPIGADFGTTTKVSFVTDQIFHKNYWNVINDTHSVIFIDERFDLSVEHIRRLIRLLDTFPTGVVGIHGADYNALTKSYTMSLTGVYNILYPSIITFNGFHLHNLRHVLPATVIQKCFVEALQIHIFDYSLSPPLLLQGGGIEKWMSGKYTSTCTEEITSRWKESSPLHYSIQRSN